MYKGKYDTEFRDEESFIKRNLIWVVGLLFIVGAVGFLLTRSVRIAENAVLNYEEFQEIYNTCSKINTDLSTIRSVDEKDQMFAQFSKQAMIAQKKQLLSRWVEEYNAKSRMWNRSLWKSGKLPYQLNVMDFDNFTR